MKKPSLFLTISIIVLMITAVACKKGKEFKTESGFKYILYTESTGKKPQQGDYVTIELVYKTAKDSVLFDTRLNKTPMRFKLETIPFIGSYEEGLTYLSEGDSATFFVAADSLFEHYFGGKENKPEQSSTVFKPGAFLLFDVKLLKVQNYVEAEQEMMMSLSVEEKKEKELLRRYLWGKDFKSSADSGIYYFRMLENGKGVGVDTGKFVTVQYTGKFLDGTVFDHSGVGSKPFTFLAGTNQVFPGWDIAMLQMKAGDRFELLIPSKYAYGEEGRINSSTGALIVPPFTPIVYDMEIIQVEDTLKLVKK